MRRAFFALLFCALLLPASAGAQHVFNIAQRTAPGQSILAATFGQYTAVEQPRALQLTLQYDF